MFYVNLILFELCNKKCLLAGETWGPLKSTEKKVSPMQTNALPWSILVKILSSRKLAPYSLLLFIEDVQL